MSDKLESEVLCTMDVEIGANHMVGDGPYGVRIIAVVTGGQVKGEQISGRVLPVGADFLLTTKDGCGQIDVRAAIELDDGSIAYATYYGKLNLPAELGSALADPEKRAQIDPSKYYFRTAPRFETGSRRYAWLNEYLFVGVGRLTEKGVSYTIHTLR